TSFSRKNPLTLLPLTEKCISSRRRRRVTLIENMSNQNSFGAAGLLRVHDQEYRIYRLRELEKKGLGSLDRLPYSIRILLENLVRNEDGRNYKASDIEYVMRRDMTAAAREINFMPARVLLQDFTGVPCVVDLAAMR